MTDIIETLKSKRFIETMIEKEAKIDNQKIMERFPSSQTPKEKLTRGRSLRWRRVRPANLAGSLRTAARNMLPDQAPHRNQEDLKVVSQKKIRARAKVLTSLLKLTHEPVLEHKLGASLPS